MDDLTGAQNLGKSVFRVTFVVAEIDEGNGVAIVEFDVSRQVIDDFNMVGVGMGDFSMGIHDSLSSFVGANKFTSRSLELNGVKSMFAVVHGCWG